MSETGIETSEPYRVATIGRHRRIRRGTRHGDDLSLSWLVKVLRQVMRGG